MDLGQASYITWRGTELGDIIYIKSKPPELLRVADDGCTAELFPYQTIDMLCREYGFDMVEW